MSTNDFNFGNRQRMINKNTIVNTRNIMEILKSSISHLIKVTAKCNSKMQSKKMLIISTEILKIIDEKECDTRWVVMR